MNVYTKQNACVRTIPPHIRPWQACEFAENARVIRFFWSKHFQTFCIDGWPSRRYRHVSTHIFYSPIVEENISFLASSTLPVESQSIIPTFEMTINPFLPSPRKTDIFSSQILPSSEGPRQIFREREGVDLITNRGYVTTVPRRREDGRGTRSFELRVRPEEFDHVYQRKGVNGNICSGF